METLTFDAAVIAIVNLATSPSNDEKLKIYGLYKQATVGNINIPAPGFFDFAGGAKWKAWNEMNGKFQEQAKVEYVDLVAALISKYGRKIEIVGV
jgi:acyl-CoA-binding protein